MPFTHEQYLRFQEKYRARRGDRVKVLFRARTNDNGSNTFWNPDMDQCVGRMGTIVSVGDSGICVRVDNDTNYPEYQGGWYFPYFCLSLVR